MAYTLSMMVNGVPGNLRMASMQITPDAATGVITVPGATAIDAIVGFDTKSAASVTCTNIRINANASGVAANGVIGFSNVVANAVYLVTVLYH